MRRLARGAGRAGAVAALGLALAIAPGSPASADDISVGPVRVEEYQCDPTVPPTPNNPCPKPVDCTDQALGQPCRKVCIDPDDLALCLWHTPGGYEADVDGACAGYLGDPTKACANGFDGCALTASGVRIDVKDGDCG